MTWTTPRTWVTAELITASIMNTHVRDNLLHLRGYGEHSCVAFHNATQNVTAGNTDALNLNSEDYDTSTMHDTVTANNQITVPVTGKYICVGSSFAANNNNGGCELQLRVNGTAVRRSQATSESADFGDRTLHVFGYLSLTAGDDVDLAGLAGANDVAFGSATAAMATRLEVVGPFPNP